MSMARVSSVAISPRLRSRRTLVVLRILRGVRADSLCHSPAVQPDGISPFFEGLLLVFGDCQVTRISHKGET